MLALPYDPLPPPFESGVVWSPMIQRHVTYSYGASLIRGLAGLLLRVWRYAVGGEWLSVWAVLEFLLVKSCAWDFAR